MQLCCKDCLRPLSGSTFNDWLGMLTGAVALHCVTTSAAGWPSGQPALPTRHEQETQVVCVWLQLVVCMTAKQARSAVL